MPGALHGVHFGEVSNARVEVFVCAKHLGVQGNIFWKQDNVKGQVWPHQVWGCVSRDSGRAP
jgi:hypothetical protein